MTTFFLLVLAVHVLLSLLVNREDARKKQWIWWAASLAIQLPLFVLACAYAVMEDEFSRQLVSPVYIGVGILAGHFIFTVSLLLTNRDVREIGAHLFHLAPVFAYVVESPVVLSRFIGVAFAEELIYRVTAQPMLVQYFGGGVWGTAAALLLVAAAFSIVHRHFFMNSLDVSLEFIGFAILLGVIYHFTGSFVLVIVIHALRDIEIAYLEYLIKLDECGDKELALREIERTFFQHQQQTGKP